MAEQFLSDFRAPNINLNAARRVLANEVLFQIMQGVIETDGQGITQRFSNDVSGAQIRIIVPQALNINTRQLGATLNGNNFADKVKQPSSTAVGLDVLEVIDTPIDIPQVTQDMLPINLLETVTKQLGMEINTQINGMTIASKVANTIPAISRGEVESWVIDPENDSGEVIRYVLTQANTALDNGDPDNNLAYYPQDDRIMVIKASFRPLMLKNGAIVLNANYGMDVIRTGAVSTDASRDFNRSAIIGTFDGLPVAASSPLVWSTACKFLGVPVYALDEVLGYVSSGYANVRAIAQQEQMKIIDSPDGVGVRLQPLVRMGARSFYATGNQFIVTPKFDVEALITAAGGVITGDPNYAGNLTVRGYGSRTALGNGTAMTGTVGGRAGTVTGTTIAFTNVAAGDVAVSLNVATGAKIELINARAIGATTPVYALDTLAFTFATANYKPASLKVRVTAPDGTAVVYTLTFAYA